MLKSRLPVAPFKIIVPHAKAFGNKVILILNLSLTSTNRLIEWYTDKL